MTSRWIAVACACISTVLLLPGKSAARDAPATYALVIGSNAGGPGQQPLRFAERDAERFAELLTELGRTPAQNVSVLLSPARGEVEQSLDALGTSLETHRQRGEPTRLVFYYSGHARADAANLADATLPLSELRARLGALPTTLTLVILDACQDAGLELVDAGLELAP